MTTRRVYLPATLRDLEALLADGALPPAPRTAYAVTSGLAASLPRVDQEEREYAAFLDAVDAATASANGGRRVVIAADASADHVIEEAGTRVEISGRLRRGDLASFHVDELVGGDEADLLWYDATEAALVRDLLRGDPGR